MDSPQPFLFTAHVAWRIGAMLEAILTGSCHPVVQISTYGMLYHMVTMLPQQAVGAKRSIVHRCYVP